VVGRETILNLNSAGADDAKEAIEEGREDDADKRPNLDAPETLDLAQASAEGETIVPDEATVEVETVDQINPSHAAQTAVVRGSQNAKSTADLEGADSKASARRRRRKPAEDKPVDSSEN